MNRTLLALCFAATFVCGCDEEYVSVDPFTATYAYACVGKDDAQCDDSKPVVATSDIAGLEGVPLVAVGSTFNVTSATGTVLLPTLDRILPTDVGYDARIPGVAAIGGTDGFLHVELATPDHLDIRHESVENSFDFDQIVGVDGFSLRFPTDRFRVQVLDAKGRVLAGSFGTTWVTTNPLVLTINGGEFHASIANFAIEGSGTAKLEAVVGKMVVDVSFEVN